jgi:hypothetical protein
MKSGEAGTPAVSAQPGRVGYHIMDRIGTGERISPGLIGAQGPDISDAGGITHRRECDGVFGEGVRDKNKIRCREFSWLRESFPGYTGLIFSGAYIFALP